LITNIQSVHLEGLGTLEKLKEEKGELYRKMRRDGTILVNQDDARVVDLASDYPGQKITLGIEHPAEVMAKGIQLKGAEGTSFTLILEGEVVEIHLPLLGRQFIPNALSAMAVACLFGVEVKEAKQALENYRPFSMRMEIVQGGKTAINDAYNANPYSMEFALETLVEVKGKGRAIAVLGDMLELGSFEKEAHQRIGQKVSQLSIDFLLAMGEQASVVLESAVRYGFPKERALRVKTHSEAASLLRQITREADWILVKGSRRMTMEKIIEDLKERRA
jgi:UDP-N-acetylmuramoyl-tripeptide--D-alanyl-D-alanine ligase